MNMLFYHTALLLMTWLSSPGQMADRVKGKGDQPLDNRPAHLDMHNYQGTQRADRLFTQMDALKILGKPAYLSDSSTTAVSDTLRFKCTYTANNKALPSGKTANIYFMYEHFGTDATAKKLYAVFKTSNEGAPGMKRLANLGDEAYYHSDNDNFALVIARKGSKLLRIKVNMLTAATSTNALLETAMRITASM